MAVVNGAGASCSLIGGGLFVFLHDITCKFCPCFLCSDSMLNLLKEIVLLRNYLILK